VYGVFEMSLQLSEDTKWIFRFIIALVAIFGFLFFVIGIYADYNDQEYLKTLDKLTCDQVWQLGLTNGFDSDTTNYYGDRCN